MRKKTENIYKERSTASLFDAIRNGNEVSFAQYYEASIDNLVYHIYAVTQDLEEARNIAHDTFIKLWQQREEIEKFDGFLFTTATNAALDTRKKKRVQTKYNNEQLFVQDVADHSADARIVAFETESRIIEVIRNMPPQRRKVFELSREKGLTYNEIAEDMNLSYNTVRNYMASALEEIRSVLLMLLIIIVSLFR